MLRYMLPASFWEFLRILRCPKTRLPTGRELELNMVSTMGNGYTFPLQTMLFASVVRGVAVVDGVRLTGDNFGVFGDDIICPSQIHRHVVKVLSLLGFTVNATKSFVEGPFRESCGADFFLGENVRGVYIKKILSPQDAFVAINSLNLWSAKTGVYLNQTVCYLYELVQGKAFPVPLDEAADAGIWTPLSYVTKRRASRFGTYGYRSWVPREYAFYILGGVVWTFKDQVRRNYNPAGLYISLLEGCIRGSRVLLRQRKIRYTVKLRKTPRWDFLPPREIEGLHGPCLLRRFVDAWHWNLLGSSALPI
jgi:hypothetical protein